MRLSTKGKYALEALVQLAYESNDNHVISLHKISTSANISEGYLEQLFSLLKKNQIVASKKGKSGGYYLLSDPKSITVGQILRASEGSLAPVKCIENNNCPREDECLTVKLWKNVYDHINEVVDHITLQSLIEDYKKRLAEKGEQS